MHPSSALSVHQDHVFFKSLRSTAIHASNFTGVWHLVFYGQTRRIEFNLVQFNSSTHLDIVQKQ